MNEWEMNSFGSNNVSIDKLSYQYNDFFCNSLAIHKIELISYWTSQNVTLVNEWQYFRMLFLKHFRKEGYDMNGRGGEEIKTNVV